MLSEFPFAVDVVSRDAVADDLSRQPAPDALRRRPRGCSVSADLMTAPAELDARTRELDQAILDRIGPDRHRLWFHQKTRFRIDDETIVVGVATLFLHDWLNAKFRADIQSAAQDVTGRRLAVKFRVDPDLFQAARREQEKAKEGPAPQPVSVLKPKPKGGTTPSMFGEEHATKPARRRSALPKRRWRTLADFVESPGNRVALAAAQSVIDEPGLGPNPLILHGPTGIGKTHLLEGIVVGLRRRQPELNILFVTAEDFTNRFLGAMHQGKQSSFRRQFRQCDVLLIDDLHFLARKKATVEEFQHTFDALLDDGKQIVATCDCHPRLNDDFPADLMDRLLGGAIWGLLPPDPTSRLELLRAKAKSDSQPIPEDVLRFLADHLRGNVRELEGAVTSIRHLAKVTGRKIDVGLTRDALGELLRHAVRIVRVADVDHAVCQALQLPSGTLQEKQRSWAVSHPRMLAIYLCRKHTAASFGEISKYFGSKSHSSAVVAEKKVRQWLQERGALSLGGRELPIRDLIDRIERQLGK